MTRDERVAQVAREIADTGSTGIFLAERIASALRREGDIQGDLRAAEVLRDQLQIISRMGKPSQARRGVVEQLAAAARALEAQHGQA